MTPGSRGRPPGVRSALVILAPLRVEASALRRGGNTARVRVTGMGPAASRRHRHLGADCTAGPVAVAGFCGSLREGVEPGHVVVGCTVRGPDGEVELPAAAAVGHCLRRAGLTVHIGVIDCTDHVVKGAERRRRAPSGHMAVDMESYWLVQGTLDRRSRGRSPRGVVQDRPLDSRSVAVTRVVSDSPAAELGLRPLLTSGMSSYRCLTRVGRALEAWAAAVGERRVVAFGTDRPDQTDEGCDLVVALGAADDPDVGRLRDLAARNGTRAITITAPADLDPADLVGAGTVALATAASAAIDLEENVLEILAAFGPLRPCRPSPFPGPRRMAAV